VNRSDGGGLPIEQFIQALTSQLDRAQAALALKADAGLPLTFAVKDLSLELRTHVDMAGSVVRIAPAGPGDPAASTLRLSLTTITKPMIEENTPRMAVDKSEPSLKEAVGTELNEEEQRRLEWAGVHTVSQLQQLQQRSGEDVLERVAQIPALRLRAALERATHPFIEQVSLHTPANGNGNGSGDGSRLLRIHGHNLMEDGHPLVQIGGESVPVLKASRRELLVSTLPQHASGELVVETSPGRAVQTRLNLAALGIPVHDATSSVAALPKDGGKP